MDIKKVRVSCETCEFENDVDNYECDGCCDYGHWEEKRPYGKLKESEGE